MIRYGIVLEKADDNYSAYAPDLPGCVATVADVEREMHDAIVFHLDGIRADGIAPPELKSVVDYMEA